jgi:hypothetical protein
MISRLRLRRPRFHKLDFSKLSAPKISVPKLDIARPRMPRSKMARPRKYTATRAKPPIPQAKPPPQKAVSNQAPAPLGRSIQPARGRPSFNLLWIAKAVVIALLLAETAYLILLYFR